VAGGLDRLGGPLVLAGLPDVRVEVVLAAVVDGDADTERQGVLALGNVAVADAVGVVGGHPEVGVEVVEGLLAGAFGRLVGVIVVPVAVVGLVGAGGVVSGQVRT
jgi:hypothetical protein